MDFICHRGKLTRRPNMKRCSGTHSESLILRNWGRPGPGPFAVMLRSGRGPPAIRGPGSRQIAYSDTTQSCRGRADEGPGTSSFQYAALCRWSCLEIENRQPGAANRTTPAVQSPCPRMLCASAGAFMPVAFSRLPPSKSSIVAQSFVPANTTNSSESGASGDLFCEGAIDPRSTDPSEIAERAQLTPACLVFMRGLQRAEDIELRVRQICARDCLYAIIIRKADDGKPKLGSDGTLLSWLQVGLLCCMHPESFLSSAGLQASSWAYSRSSLAPSGKALC
jgi:hypothetical protein